MNQKLIVYANDEVYNVDMYDSEPIEIVKSIFDIENPEQRKADYTKTIRIPGTSNNNKIFSFIFDLSRFTINDTLIQFNPDFNAALKTSAILYRNEIVQIKGYIQLMGVIKRPDGGVDYDIVIIGELASLYKDMGEAKLSELDLSEFNHVLNLTNVDSLGNNPTDGYYYPVIDTGLSTNESSYFIDQLAPGIFIKTLIDKIFQTYGYTYTSDFFDTAMFQRLILWAGDNPDQFLTSTEVFDRTFLAQQQTDSSYLTIQLTTDAESVKTIVLPTVVTQSVPSGYNNSTGRFTVQDAGYYRFKTTGEIYIKNTGALTTIKYYAVVRLMKSVGGVPSTLVTQTLEIPIISTNQVEDYPIHVEMYSDQYFQANDELYVTISMDVNPAAAFQWKIATVNAPYSFTSIPSARKYEGVTINLSKFVPSEMTQAEFMTNIKNCFNLYFDPDPDIPKKLKIEPRDDYYTQTVIDLTNKVDYSKEIVIKPLELSKYRTYQFSFDKDTDEYNTYYNNISELPYGYRKFDVVNEFATDIKNVKVTFAPTPLSDTPLWHTRTFSKVRFKGGNGTITPKASKGRLLYAKNLVAGIGTNVVVFVSYLSTSVAYAIYQYAGHLDDPDNPTIDLNFGVPTVLYYDASGYTTNNLFNKYWRKNILELTDPDSKVVELYARLNDVEIKNMTFDKLYLIDRQYYRLQEIKYDANNIGTVFLRLLKVLRYNNWSDTDTTPINGGSGEFIYGDGEVLGEMPNYDVFKTKGDNLITNQTSQTTQGEGNQQGADTDNVVVNSKDNSYAGEYINILGGGDNDVFANNVGLYGCSGYIASIEGEQAINNIQQPFQVTYDLASAVIGLSHENDTVVLPKFDGYYTEIYNAYATLDAGGAAYNNTVTYLDYGTTSAGVNGVANWAASFLSSATDAAQRAVISEHSILRSEDIVWKSASNPDSGTGSVRLYIHYRLIKI